ncbi:LytR/AlgR family response regulator transcription factor [Alteromonas aestuariivivens]|nr:LytTR family DNA-binding domain-containing protein [Alteromonas aestuariivivens]
MKTNSTSLEAWLPRFEAALFSRESVNVANAVPPVERDVLSVIAVIKSDGSPHRQALAEVLEQHENVTQVFLCEDLQSITEVLVSFSDAVLFADCSTLNRLSPAVVIDHPCVVIGGSNHDALDAFGLRACDFLQLPYDEASLANCLTRVMSGIEKQRNRSQYSRLCSGLTRHLGVSQEDLVSMLRKRCESSERPGMLGVRTDKGWYCVHPADIRWIEAAGDYMCLYTAGENHIIRSTLTELVKRLDSEDFVRVSRSIVVNRQHVENLSCQAPNTYYLAMDDGSQIKISRRYYTAYWQNYAEHK